MHKSDLKAISSILTLPYVTGKSVNAIENRLVPICPFEQIFSFSDHNYIGM